MVIGRLLGNRYEILEKIGGGGMSLVFRAKDMFLNRIVAVKILREQLTCDEEFVARFRREAQAVASLSHGNIVSIYDVGQDKDTHYLVMEMVEGKNLKEIIKERAPLSAEEVVDIAKQICDALDHAHEHKIIHRDIKPHNIIIKENGKVKVTDFGIARAVSTATVTHTGSIMGSVHYFSPEQARGTIADEKSDIYSLGVVLYELLTGVLPFQGETPFGVAMKKLNEDPRPIREINNEVPESLEKVVLKAMDREPANRHQNVKVFKDELVSAFLYNNVSYDYQKQELTEDTISIPLIKTRKQSKNKDGDLKTPVKVWTWILLGVIIVGFLIGMYLSATVLAKGDVEVPNVVELSIASARDVLDEASLSLTVSKYVYHAKIGSGGIVAQNPKAKEIVKKNGTVNVIVSKGPTIVVVPNVVNSSLLSAEVTLDNEDLELGDITRVYHSQIPSGQVVHQEPGAGESVSQGTKVNLIVSRGPEPIWIKMPNLSGININQAKAILENNQLVLGVVQSEKSITYRKDIVIRQDPGPESEILQGSTVNLVISAGPGPQGEEARVKVNLPNSGTVKIIVLDDRGRNTAYEKYHYSGDIIDKTFYYYGKGIIEVLVNNELIERKAVG